MSATALAAVAPVAHPDDLHDDDPVYTAKVIEKIAHGSGFWATARIGVFEGDRQIGEYARNYPSYGATTFAPFKQGGVWYALYSRHYTATRVMRLPDCVDLGGEDPAGHGFCPMEYLVPEIDAQDLTPADPYPPKDPSQDSKARMAEFDAWQKRNPYSSRHAKWGFVGGCYWGGDSGGLDVEFLDLSRVAEGVLTRSRPFGFIQLAEKVRLKDGVHVSDPDSHTAPPADVLIEFAVPKLYRLDGRPWTSWSE